jgi:hypothetical protein
LYEYGNRPLVVVAYFSHVVVGGNLTLVLVYRIVGTRLVYILGISMKQISSVAAHSEQVFVLCVCSVLQELFFYL